jgi:hypothetical protein
VADDDVGPRRADFVDEAGCEGADDLAGELAADEAAHVVRLYELGQINGGRIHDPKTT